MGKNKKKKTIQETLSSIDAVMTALNAYPNIEDALMEKAQEKTKQYLGQFFPTQLDFAKDILEHLVGTDVMIDIVSSFLTVGLPPVEMALKAALLANMQSFGSKCSIDPIIYEKAVKEGIIFDLRQIDLYDKLTVSPLDSKIGKYFYFGTDNCQSSYDVLMSAIDPNNQTERRKGKMTNGANQKEGTSYINRTIDDSIGHYFSERKRDFDCLLWYMKNKSATRQVWGKRTSVSEDIFNGNGSILEWLKKKGKKNTVYYEIKNENGVQKTHFYQYDDQWSEIQDKGNCVPMTSEKIYWYKDGNTFYKYIYGNPEIVKITRKKVYVCSTTSASWDIYVFDETNEKWSTIAKAPHVYKTMEDLEKESNLPKKEDIVSIGNDVYLLTEDIEIKEVKEKDSDGKEYTAQKIKSFTGEKCIDITSGILNNINLYVDYDELENGVKKGELIKDGFIPTSSISNENTGKKHWYKKKLNLTEEEIEQLSDHIKCDAINCYFGDYNGDGNYTQNVDKILIPPFFYKNAEGETKKCVCINDFSEKFNKYTKEFGILTLDYSPRTGNLLQSDGDPMHQQTPYDNVLHVFFGNVKELPTSERDGAEAAWAQCSDSNKEALNALNELTDLNKRHILSWSNKQKTWKKEKIEAKYILSENICFENAYNFYKVLLEGGIQKIINEQGEIKTFEFYDTANDIEDLTQLTNIITNVAIQIDRWRDNIYGGKNQNEFNPTNFEDFENELKKILLATKEDEEPKKYYSVWAIADRIRVLMDANETSYYLHSQYCEYPEAKKNYYLHRTLFEFNIDYVNSLQLFDPKVLTAQIITSLFGGFAMTLNPSVSASWKTEFIRDVVKDMVQKQIAAEDFTVSDCFFTFSNDAYNGMLRAADLRQAKLYSQHGEENSNSKIDPVKLLEGLNEIDNCADQAGQTTIIKGLITNAAGEICKDVDSENTGWDTTVDKGISMGFIDTLITNLCTQLVMAMLSPKVYLLILINLEMFGLSTNFDLKAFLEKFEALIRSIVKSVVDQFMQYIVGKITELIEDIIQKLIQKLALEQVEMYARLLKQILMHLRMLTKCGDGLGWTQDIIGYADIIGGEATEEPINEC